MSLPYGTKEYKSSGQLTHTKKGTLLITLPPRYFTLPHAIPGIIAHVMELISLGNFNLF